VPPKDVAHFLRPIVIHLPDDQHATVLDIAHVSLSFLFVHSEPGQNSNFRRLAAILVL
jgi:hypothetical protein